MVHLLLTPGCRRSRHGRSYGTAASPREATGPASFSANRNAYPWGGPRMGIQEGPVPNGGIWAARCAASNDCRSSPDSREGDPAAGKARLLTNICRACDSAMANPGGSMAPWHGRTPALHGQREATPLPMAGNPIDAHSWFWRVDLPHGSGVVHLEAASPHAWLMISPRATRKLRWWSRAWGAAIHQAGAGRSKIRD